MSTPTSDSSPAGAANVRDRQPGGGRSSGRRSRSLGANLMILALVLIVLAVAYFVVNRGTETNAPVTGLEDQALPKVDSPAPVFSTEDINGMPVDLQHMRGKPVWLVVMATWCQGCRSEVSDIEAAFRSHGKQIAVVAVYSGEKKDAVTSYVERTKLTFRHIADESKSISRLYGATSLPTHFFIDADGVVRYTRVGVMGPEQINAALAKVGVR